MIRVRLPSAPQELLDGGAVELGKARAHFGDDAMRGQAVRLRRYKLTAVKEALNVAFHFKCAYCESFFGATQPARRRALPAEERCAGRRRARLGRLLLARRALGEPAAVVHRLQPAAQADTARRQRADARQGEPVPDRLRGRSGRRRRETRSSEARLLVHPYLDDPGKHFVFEPDGIVSWTTARRASESIRVYALLRRGLVQARRALQLEVLTHISIARGLALELQTSGPNPRLEALLLQELEALARFVDARARVQRDRASADRARPGGADGMSDDPRHVRLLDSPRRTCDVVMKGGITSGVVYPHALCELARTYRFANVGGTSAGAIAAAAAAAAEHGREQGGFEKLAALPDWVGAGDNLFRLFQPQPRTRPFFRLFTAGLGRKGAGKWLRVGMAALRSFPLTAAAGLAPGVALAVLAAWTGSGALAVAAVRRRDRARAARARCSHSGFASPSGSPRAVGRNHFGLCSGMSPEGSAPPR